MDKRSPSNQEDTAVYQQADARLQVLKAGYATLSMRRQSLQQELQRVERELVMLEGAITEFELLLSPPPAVPEG